MTITQLKFKKYINCIKNLQENTDNIFLLLNLMIISQYIHSNIKTNKTKR